MIEKLLDYLYTTDYNDTPAMSPLLLNAKIYVAADFYLIPSLKKAAQSNFEQILTDLCNQSEPPEKLYELPTIMEYIYENTEYQDGTGLRQSAASALVRHAEKFFDRDEGLKDAMLKVMEATGSMGADFGIALLNKWKGFRKVQCQQCWHIWADPRSSIPNVRCPGCEQPKSSWGKYEVN